MSEVIPRNEKHYLAKLNRQKKQQFIDYIREHGNISAAAAEIGISRTTAYDHKEKDVEFSKAWDEAWNIFLDGCEHEVARRGFKGYDNPIYYKGEKVGEQRYYSDNLAMFYLKAKRPEFRDHQQDNTGAQVNLFFTIPDSSDPPIDITPEPEQIEDKQED